MKPIPYFQQPGTCLLLALLIYPCYAEVTLDGSLGGSARALPGSDYVIQADMGAQRGGNLFHSFGDFNLSAAESATFNGVGAIAPVENILSRVTGGRPSIINGQISTEFANSEPNLFFMNPAGVVFGPTASLDVQGSFHVTTANYLKLENGDVFHADLNEKTTLSVAAVEAFGFTEAQVGDITINQSFLHVPEGETLSVIGGDIHYVSDGLESSSLFATGGRINLASVVSSGEVLLGQDNLDVINFAQLGDIQLSNGAKILVSGDYGRIMIRSATLALDNALIAAEDSKRDGQGINITLTDSLLIENDSLISYGSLEGANRNVGNLTIDTQQVEVRSGAQIRAGTAGVGKGGDLYIETESLLLDGENTSIKTVVDQASTGNAGHLTIDAQQIEVCNGASIGAVVFGAGQGGDLSITTSSLLLDSRNAPNFTGITAQTQDSGDAGHLSINAQQIEVYNGAQIDTNTFGSGQGGNLSITTNGLTLDGKDALLATQAASTGIAGSLTVDAQQIDMSNGGQISAITIDADKGGDVHITTNGLRLESKETAIVSQTQGTGDASNLAIEAEWIEIHGGAEINVNTFSQGKGGDLSIVTDSLLLDGNNASKFTIIAAQNQGTGDAGSLTINAQQLELRNEALISAGTFGTGKGGNLSITTDSLLLDGTGASHSDDLVGISIQTEGAGNASNLTIEAQQIEVRNGAQISAGTFGSGKGGNLTIVTKNLLLDRGDDPNITGISVDANPETTGDAGNLTIDAQEIEVRNGAVIGASTFGQGRGGKLTIRAQQIAMDNRAIIGSISGSQSPNQSQSPNPGISGNITITVNDFLTLTNNSQIIVETTQANAGDITLNLGHLLQLSDDSAITTSAAVINRQGTGTGGNINIKSSGTKPSFAILDDNSQIIAQAQQGNGGEINIDANTILFRAPGSVISASSQSGETGAVTIDSPDTNLIDSALILPGAFLDASALLSQRCADRGGKSTGSFIIKPLDGIQPTPEDYLSGFYTVTTTPTPADAHHKPFLPLDRTMNHPQDSLSSGCTWY